MGTSGWERTQSALLYDRPTLLLTIPSIRFGYDHQRDEGLYSYLPVDHPLPDVRTFNTFFADLYLGVGLSYRFLEVGLSAPLRYDQLNLNETGEMFYAYGFGNPTLTLKSAYRFRVAGVLGGMGIMGYYGPLVGDTGSTTPIRNVRERYRFTRGLVRVFNEPDHFAFGGILSLRGERWSYDLNLYMGGADLDVNVSNLLSFSVLSNLKILGEGFVEVDGPVWAKVGLAYVREGLTVSLSYDHLFTLGNYPDVRYSNAWPDYWDVLLKPDATVWFSISYTLPLYRYKHTVRVKVVSTEGKPVSDATIILGSKMGRADEMGSLKFENVKEGRYSLKITAKGYYPEDRTVEVLSDTTLAVILQEARTEERMTEYFIRQAEQSAKAGDYDDAEHFTRLALIWAPDTSYEREVKVLMERIRRGRYMVLRDSLTRSMERGDYAAALIYLNGMDSLVNVLGWGDSIPKLQRLRDSIYTLEIRQLNFPEARKVVSLIGRRRYRKAINILKRVQKRRNSRTLKRLIRHLNVMRREYVGEVLLRVSSLIASGRYNEAERLLGEAIREDPKNPKVKALKRRLLRRKRARARMLYTEALSHLEKGDTLMAITKLKEAISIANVPEAKGLLRNLKVKRKKRISRDVLDRMYLIGLEAYQRGDYRRAYEIWREILKYDSTYTRARLNVERLKHMMGEE